MESKEDQSKLVLLGTDRRMNIVVYGKEISDEEQAIHDEYKSDYRRLQKELGKTHLSFEESWPISEKYKAAHTKLAKERKAREAAEARAVAFNETHSERICRDCGDVLPTHVPNLLCDNL